jgi:hypothetical protein
MNKREILEEIIKQNGRCIGVECATCPFEDGENCYVGDLSPEGILVSAKEELEKLRGEQCFNKREILEEIIKQNGACYGIRCVYKDIICPFYNDFKHICEKIKTNTDATIQAKQILAEMDKEKGKMSKFKVGDLVFCLMCGWGIINRYDLTSGFPLVVEFEYITQMFTIYGKNHSKEKHPILFTREEAAVKFPEYPEPKRKVKKTLERWISIYPNDVTYTDKEKPKENAHNRTGLLHCERIEIQYEV